MKTWYAILIFLCSHTCYSQVINSIYGGGASLGDGGPATAALIVDPGGILYDKNWNLFIVCGTANTIRKISYNGIITTIVGTGSSGYSGDGGMATDAKLNFPVCIAFDSLGNIFFSDSHNNVIRKFDIHTNVITTICGTGIRGFSGDGGTATNAQLNGPNGICFDKNGNFFIADGGNNRIRTVDKLGNISTFAGTGIYGYNGDGIAATLAKLNLPIDILADNNGNYYISDGSNARIRKIDNNGIISTFAGNGNGIYVADKMPATAAQFSPLFLKFDNYHNLFITDDGNCRIYYIDNNNIFHLVAGNGTRLNGGDGGQATAAQIHYPTGMAFDSCNNLIFSNVAYNRIRKIAFNPFCFKLPVENLSYESFAIYPNPATYELQIDNLKTTTKYQLYNMLGSTLIQGTLKPGNNTLPLDALEPGIYMLALVDEEGEKTVHKIVKQ